MELIDQNSIKVVDQQMSIENAQINLILVPQVDAPNFLDGAQEELAIAAHRHFSLWHTYVVRPHLFSFLINT